MSLVTNPALYEFQRWLRDPENPFGPANMAELADLVMTGRAHLSLVLNGKRAGGHTWRRLVAVLPDEGLSLLKQCSAWNKYAEAAWQARERKRAELDDFSKRFGPKPSVVDAQKPELVKS